MTDGSACCDSNHAGPDRRAARVTVVSREGQRAGPPLVGHPRAVDDARVGGGIRAVEDERAVVGHISNERSGGSAGADLQ